MATRMARIGAAATAVTGLTLGLMAMLLQGHYSFYHLAALPGLAMAGLQVCPRR